ncbi:MAG: aminotransferase class V-fold PLP-dependent enzyme [Gallionella sp.]|jgi:cysteine desulfurase|nr:aminotransferase class V-fold PLP-dependent enzyme [Gallionella sp.]
MHSIEGSVTSRIDHPAIFIPCRFLERLGATVTYVPVDGTGRVDPDDIRKPITGHPSLISIMHANSEVGRTLPPDRADQPTEGRTSCGLSR